MREAVEITCHLKQGRVVWREPTVTDDVVNAFNAILDIFQIALKNANLINTCVIVRPSGVICKSSNECETCYPSIPYYITPSLRCVMQLENDTLKIITPSQHNSDSVSLSDPDSIDQLERLFRKITERPIIRKSFID